MESEKLRQVPADERLKKRVLRTEREVEGVKMAGRSGIPRLERWRGLVPELVAMK